MTGSVAELIESKEEEILEKLREADKEAMLRPDLQVTVFLDTETGELSSLQDVKGGNISYPDEYSLYTFSHNEEVWESLEPQDCLAGLQEILKETDKTASERLDDFCEAFRQEYEESIGIPESISENLAYERELWNAVESSHEFADGIVSMCEEQIDLIETEHYQDIYQNILEECHSEERHEQYLRD